MPFCFIFLLDGLFSISNVIGILMVFFDSSRTRFSKCARLLRVFACGLKCLRAFNVSPRVCACLCMRLLVCANLCVCLCVCLLVVVCVSRVYRHVAFKFSGKCRCRLRINAFPTFFIILQNAIQDFISIKSGFSFLHEWKNFFKYKLEAL